MILLIDTTRGRDVRVGLWTGKLKSLRRKFERPGSVVVQMVDELLKKQKILARDFSGVVVATGPGPFSSLRAGVAVANTLSYVLKIPVAGIAGEMTLRQLAQQGSGKLKRAKVGNIVVPKYGRPPNITKKGVIG